MKEMDGWPFNLAKVASLMKVFTTKDIFQKSSMYIFTVAQWVHSENK